MVQSLAIDVVGQFIQLGMRACALVAHFMGERGRKVEAWLRRRIAEIEGTEDQESS